MFGSRQQGTVIGKGLKIAGSITADGLVWVYGQIDGELHCTYLVIDRDAHIGGTITAERCDGASWIPAKVAVNPHFLKVLTRDTQGPEAFG